MLRHAGLEQVCGLTFTSNAFNAAKDDRGKGEYSPDYGIVYGGLTNSVIKDNVLHNAALKQATVDLGGHGEGVIVKDNPSSVFVPGKTPETLRYQGHTGADDGTTRRGLVVDVFARLGPVDCDGEGLGLLPMCLAGGVGFRPRVRWRPDAGR